ENEVKLQNDTVKTEDMVASSIENILKRMEPLNVIYKEFVESSEDKIAFLKSMSEGEFGETLTIKERIKFLQRENEELSMEIYNIKDNMEELKVKKAKLEMNVANYVKNIVEEFNIPIETAVKIYPNKPGKKEDYLEEIKKLKQKIGRMGTVNPLAVEECNKLEKREEFLSSQISDLKESEKVMDEIVKEIEKKICKRFNKTFKEINKNFKKIFNYLFPNGKAELILIDEADSMKSGVEIIAEPLGKRLKRLTLLSGGEKALVAISLLFAFHYTSPSPFYVFDEVEPSLDDINLQKFINLLKKIKEEAQVVIITHQRRTMEIADIIYGVSMGVDGVSKAFSKKITEMKEAKAY
ncbi:MAG: hypothetical protein KAS39_08795, partial [Actinomycetia bacterium]|nr:hypothetical protein [Actinomycetes bacterium]